MIGLFDESRVAKIQSVEDLRVQDFLARLEQIYQGIVNSKDDSEEHITNVLNADRTSRALRSHVNVSWNMEELAQTIAVDIHYDILNEIEADSVTLDSQRQLRFTEAIKNLEMRFEHFQKVRTAVA